MSLLLTKNDFQEFVCKFRGHTFSDEIRQVLRSQKPQIHHGNCLKCNCRLEFNKIDEKPTYLVSKCYDEEEGNDYQK